MHYQTQHLFKWANCCFILFDLVVLKKVGWFFLVVVLSVDSLRGNMYLGRLFLFV